MSLTLPISSGGGETGEEQAGRIGARAGGESGDKLDRSQAGITVIWYDRSARRAREVQMPREYSGCSGVAVATWAPVGATLGALSAAGL